MFESDSVFKYTKMEKELFWATTICLIFFALTNAESDKLTTPLHQDEVSTFVSENLTTTKPTPLHQGEVSTFVSKNLTTTSPMPVDSDEKEEEEADARNAQLDLCSGSCKCIHREVICNCANPDSVNN